MNDFVLLYRKLFGLRIVKFDKNPLQDYRLVEKAPKDKFYSGLKYDNSFASVNTAGEILSNFKENEPLDMKWVQTSVLKRLKLTREVDVVGAAPRARDFSNDDEKRLLRAILREKNVIKEKKMLNKEGSIKLEFWKLLQMGDLNKIVDIETTTLQYNICLIDAVAYEEEDLEYNGVTVKTSNISPKEMTHVRNELREYAKRVCNAPNVATPEVRARAVTTTTTIPEAVFQDFQQSPQLEDEEIPVENFISPPPIIPRSDPVQINQEVYIPPQLANSSNEIKIKPSESCLDCGFRKGHINGCHFVKWIEDSARIEDVNRLTINGKRESNLMAFRRVWKVFSKEIIERYKS